MGYHIVGNSIYGPSAHSDDLCSSSLSVSGDTALDLANSNTIFHAPLLISRPACVPQAQLSAFLLSFQCRYYYLVTLLFTLHFM